MAQTERGKEPSGTLHHLWERQRGWSNGANVAKNQVERARISNLALVVGAAVLGALAAQSDWLSSGFQRTISLAAALFLLLAGFIQSEYLTSAKVKAWTGARGASETLKAMIYANLAGVELGESPGTKPEDRAGEQAGELADQEVAGTALLDWLTAVEARAFALGSTYGKPDGKPLPDIAGVVDYRTRRTEEQGQWHAARYGDHDRRAKRLRLAQLALTATGSLLAFLAGVANLPGIDAWVAAVAAMGAAVAAHLAAGQYDRIADSYQVTASLLEREVVRFDALQSDAKQRELTRSLVQRTEEILARQNDSWIDMIERATKSG